MSGADGARYACRTVPALAMPGGAMITISAFADEIGPDLKLQMDVCQSLGIRCIDVRAIDGVNVSRMKVSHVRDYSKQMQDRGFSVPCIGSPLGKIRLDEDFDAHLDMLKHTCDVAAAFGTANIRMFSFYAPRGGKIAEHRGEVMDRLAAMVRQAEAAGMVLYHENERDIYGDTPERVKDIFATIRSPHLKFLYDPGNLTVEGLAPYDDGWKKGLDQITEYLHIKDKLPGEAVFVPAGEGVAQFAEIFQDLKERNWSGYATLEPHMKAAGRYSGFSGPEMFVKAAEGFKRICDRAGVQYQ